MPHERKICTRCRIEKPLSEFYRQNTTRMTKCKACHYEIVKVWRNRSNKTMNTIRRTLGRARQRARETGLEFEITDHFAYVMIASNGFRCAQTGIRFEIDSGPIRNRKLKSISIDRIDSNKGYTFTNVQFVCLFYNFMKSTGTDAEVWALMQEAVENHALSAALLVDNSGNGT